MQKSILTFIAIWALACQTKAASFTALVDFGDSLSDVGNLYSASGGFIPGSGGYYNGRFSNGPIWIDTLSLSLGLGAPTPSLAGGNDYAYGDAVSGLGITNIIGSLNVPNVQTQVLSFTAHHVATPTELFTVLGGANDLLDYLGGTSTTTPKQAADNIATSVSTLYGDGARNILVGNLPDLGLTPRIIGTTGAGAATGVTLQFDAELATDLVGIASTSPGLNLYNLNLFGLIDNVISNPGMYGITNDTASAYTGDPDYLGTGTIVSNPTGYLFWDAIHPTTAGQSLVAQAASAAVPEPCTVMVAAVSVAILTRRRRRQEWIER